MRLINILLAAVILFAIGCQSTPVGLSVTGALSGFSEGSIHMDQSSANGTFSSVTSGDLKSDGTFAMSTETHPGPGIYRVRTGGASSFIVLDGSEKKLKINGDQKTFPRAQFQIEGAPLTTELHQLIGDQNSGKIPRKALGQRLDQTTNPYVALAFANLALRGRVDFAPQYEGIAKRLKSSYPDQDWKEIDQMISKMKQQLAARQSAGQKVKVGQPAPDIALPDANGKVRKLSDLKGKLVLIDFWASWCGPCRKANPHVVEMYHKYKNKGFDVYSVSLDGIDDASIKRYKLDAERAEAQRQSGKNRWLQAIEKDKLTWPNHVSELTKWDSDAARTYGVRSIPRTFLVDKEGNIAAVNPRNNLEEMIQKNI